MDHDKLGKITASKKISVLATVPMSESDYLDLAQQTKSSKEMDLTIEIYEAGLKKFPDSAKINLSFARVLVTAIPKKLQDPERAVVFARKAIKLTSKPTGHNLEVLAMTLYAAGIYKEAYEVIQKATKDNSCRHILDRVELYGKKVSK